MRPAPEPRAREQRLRFEVRPEFAAESYSVSADTGKETLRCEHPVTVEQPCSLQVGAGTAVVSVNGTKTTVAVPEGSSTMLLGAPTTNHSLLGGLSLVLAATAAASLTHFALIEQPPLKPEAEASCGENLATITITFCRPRGREFLALGIASGIASAATLLVWGTVAHANAKFPKPRAIPDPVEHPPVARLLSLQLTPVRGGAFASAAFSF